MMKKKGFRPNEIKDHKLLSKKCFNICIKWRWKVFFMQAIDKDMNLKKQKLLMLVFPFYDDYEFNVLKFSLSTTGR